MSASRQLGVNNLPRFVTQPRPVGDRTRDLLIVSPTPYRCATSPPSACVCGGGVKYRTFWRQRRAFTSRRRRPLYVVVDSCQRTDNNVIAPIGRNDNATHYSPGQVTDTAVRIWIWIGRPRSGENDQQSADKNEETGRGIAICRFATA